MDAAAAAAQRTESTTSGINYSYVFKFEEEFDHVEVRGKVEEVKPQYLSCQNLKLPIS